MGPSKGLITATNAIREMVISGNAAYHQYLPIVGANTSISELAQPIFEYKPLQNAWLGALVNKIVRTQFDTRMYRNPLAQLEGEQMPMGYAVELAHVNPAKGRTFNNDDFAGLLQKYEADVKTQYISINSDLQYPVTVSARTLKQAFTSWGALQSFIEGLTNSLFNGAHIDQYNLTKNLVSAAYAAGNVQVVTLTAPTTEATGKAFVKAARQKFLDFQAPSSANNGWALAGGEGRPVVTWTDPEDVVFLIRNDVAASMDVDVLSAAFNIDRATLQGRVIYVDNFDMYDDDGTKTFDGSKILGIMADKRWFKINQQDEQMDEFYNANNRTWQYYLNIVRTYAYSLFANAVVFCTEAATPSATEISFKDQSVEIAKGANGKIALNVTPNAATVSVTYTAISAPASGNVNKLTITPSSDTRSATVAVAADAKEGVYIIQATAGDLSSTIAIEVPEVES